MREDDIIQTLQNQFPDYIGDDAAVLPHSIEEAQLISKDLLIEDIHFRRHYFSPWDLAHKALHANLSDLAAMGAKAHYLLCGISIPEKVQDYALSFLNALNVLCKELGITLIGGDTTSSPDKLYISITVIGYSPKAHIKYRHTAKTDDIIVIAGQLGWARLGLFALEQGRDLDTRYTNACLRPSAQITMGLWLGKQTGVTSMMDISDGLYTDITRLARASNLRAELHLEELPSSPDFQKTCLELGLEPAEVMLAGGEDYAILCTVSAESWPAIARAAPEPLYCIGVMQPGTGVRISEHGQPKNLTIQAFSHFE